MTDIGESLIGAYQRHLRGCHSVLYNTYLPHKQGEIDVIGLRIGDPTEVYVAEVAVHLNGLDYGGYPVTTAKVVAKMAAAREYCERVFANARLTLEFWSPSVPPGLVKQINEQADEHGFELVANKDFTDRTGELLDVARKTTKTTNEDAFRMLQLLSHLKERDALKL